MKELREVLSTGVGQLLFFGLGVVAGVMLVAFLPGMPWATVLAETTAEKQLAAETSAAAAAWWAVGVSAGSTVVGAAGLWLIYRTLLATQRSANAAHLAVQATAAGTAVTEKLGRAQTRAYISIQSVRFSFGPADIYFEIEFSNEGQSPGRNVVFQLETSLKHVPNNIFRGYHFAPVRRSAVRVGDNEPIVMEHLFEPPRPNDEVSAAIAIDIEYDDVFRGFAAERRVFEFYHPTGIKLGQTYSMRQTEELADW